MVSIYGLNERIGNISYFDSRGADMFTKPYSDDRARVIDEEVSKMIEKQYERALDLLSKNKEKLTDLANKLLSNEVIFKEDLELIFGKREWEAEQKENKEKQSTEEEEKLSLVEPVESVDDHTEVKREEKKSQEKKPPSSNSEEINEEDLND